MLVGVVNAQRRRNAEFARDVEYIREMAFEDEISDRLTDVENEMFAAESVEDYREAAHLFTDEELNDDSVFKEAEIDRILNATSDLSFDEMIGIE